MTYAAQVPSSTLVCVRQPARAKVVAIRKPQEVRELARSAQTKWRSIKLRQSERGALVADFALFRVWPVACGELATTPEWLVIRRLNEPRQYCYTLINAAAETSAKQLYEWSTRRYFVERTFEDAKSELGWAEFEARKYRAWEHHLALTGAALWFAAQTKLERGREYERDRKLQEELGVKLLPALSTANLRQLLRAVLPLGELSPEMARQAVIKHLVNRARATASRLRAQKAGNDSS